MENRVEVDDLLEPLSQLRSLEFENFRFDVSSKLSSISCLTQLKIVDMNVSSIALNLSQLSGLADLEVLHLTEDRRKY
jgi:hypothetical protein